MKYLLPFHCSSGCTNVIRTFVWLAASNSGWRQWASHRGCPGSNLGQSTWDAGQTDIRSDFIPKTSVLRCQHHITNAATRNSSLQHHWLLISATQSLSLSLSLSADDVISTITDVSVSPSVMSLLSVYSLSPSVISLPDLTFWMSHFVYNNWNIDLINLLDP